MATLIELENANRVFRIDPALGPHDQEFRRIFVLPDLRQWLEDDLPTLGSTWNIEQSPAEQLDALIATFCSDEPLTYGRQFKPLTHVDDGIWEIKTADLRIFGWFYQIDCFIGTDGDVTERIKSLQMYRPYCEQAIRRRDALELNEPKFIQGDDPNDVVSNFDFPE